MHGLDGLPALTLIALVAVRTGWREAAGELRRLLQPYEGWLPVGNGVVADLSVDHHLGALALLDDDVDGAVAAAQAALAVARRARSPLLEAHALALLGRAVARTGDRRAAASARDAAMALAEPLGLRFDDDGVVGPGPRATAAPAPAGPEARMVRARFVDGRWDLESPFGTGSVADTTGLRQLLVLVTSPGRDVPAVDLAAADGGTPVVSSDLGPALDARAKREYRRRVAELHEEIDEADAHHDGERAAKHRLELEALLDELRRAVGLGGRDRPQGSGAERARVNTARSIRRAIAAVGRAIPDLGSHLQVSVRTGHRCAYAPEPAAALTWSVER
jgi:hypothetical protein